MQRLKLFIPLLISLFCFVHPGTAQQVITNSKGEKIVVFPDGSWRHFVPADSVLIRENLRSASPFNQPEKQHDDLAEPMDPTLGKSVEAHLAIEFANELQAEADRARIALIDATNNKFNTEAKLEQARKNKGLIDADILARLEEDYERATDVVRLAKKYHKEIAKFTEQALAITHIDAPKRQKKLSRLMAKHSSFVSSSEWIPEENRGTSTPALPVISESRDTETGPARTADKAKSRAVRKGTRQEAPDRPAVPTDKNLTWSVAEEPPYKRAPVKCRVNAQIVDEATGQKRLVLEEQGLFTFTDEELRPYFRDESLVDCRAYISSIEGYRYLTVRFIIASPNARKNFGMLQQQALLRFKLLDGSYVNFYNIQASKGTIDRYSGNTIFTGNYALGRNAEKQLLKSELDKMRVVWSTGYEDYDIHEVDFFLDQIKCLNDY